MVEPQKTKPRYRSRVQRVCRFFFFFFCEVCVPLLIVRCRCLAYYYCALLSLSNIIFGLV
jgi:hypothetical protein